MRAEPPSALILDLDETLFDHVTSARMGVSRLIGELGAEPTADHVDTWERNAGLLIARKNIGEISKDEYRRLRVRHLVADIDPALDPDSVTDQQCDAIYARFLELYEQQWVAFPDVTPALTGLRLLRVPIAVLTNGPEERQQRKIGALGLGGLVDGVWTSEGIGASKPEPQAYLTVCDAMGLPPDLVLHVGDNEEFDLRGATAAGLHGVHLDRERKRPRSPDRIHHLEELCLRFA